MTLATASDEHNILETIRTSHNGIGTSLSGTRGVPDSAAGQGSNDRPREFGGRPQTARRINPDRSREIHNTIPPKKGKNTRATLKIASLNMRGRDKDKWNHINQLMRDNRIGILAVQEAHLDEPRVARLEELSQSESKSITLQTLIHQMQEG
jgi:hypothetical protein